MNFHGIDLLDSIEKEIYELSSEHRLMPSPDQLEHSTAAKVLSAAGSVGERTLEMCIRDRPGTASDYRLETTAGGGRAESTDSTVGTAVFDLSLIHILFHKLQGGRS